MTSMRELRWRQVRALVLPVTAAGIVPFLLRADFNLNGLKVDLVLVGLLLFLIGLGLLIQTIRLFGQVGQGTLAPWDPPRKLVVQGPYRYVRNPMISGVLFMLLGEAVGLGSLALFVWFGVFLVINTLYFKLLEEPGLVKRFGQEYEAYRKNVPMWIPRTKPWKSDIEG